MSNTNMYAFFDGVSEGFKASREDIVDVLKEIRQEIESNIENIIGKYDATVPEHDRASMKIARNEARRECLAIVDRHLSEATNDSCGKETN